VKFSANVNRRQFVRVKYIMRPHHSTTYVDAAYCYRPSSVVCLSVCWFVTLVSPARTAEPIEMPFGLRTPVGAGTMYYIGIQISQGAILSGAKGVPL